MAQKMSEGSWKAFLKAQKPAVELEDKELLKQLARFDKTDEARPKPRLDALDGLDKELRKQLDALSKLRKALGDKDFRAIEGELKALQAEGQVLQSKARQALEAQAREADDEEDDEDSKPAALVDPKLLFKQLTLCRKNPERRLRFAFVDAKDKQPAMLALHPRMSPRALFTKLQAASGVKTGAYGTAWVEGSSLILQPDKPRSGLAKKARPPVRSCGFKISKVVLYAEDGSVFEQDEQAEEAAAGEGAAQLTATPPVAPPAAAPAAAAAPTVAPAQPAAPRAGAELAVLRKQFLDLRMQAVGGIAQMVGRLASDPHPQAAEVARVAKRIAMTMPAGMEDILVRLDQAARGQDTEAVARQRASLKQCATDWLAFLQANRSAILGCETNPWGIPIRIDKPLRASLGSILGAAR